MTAEHTNGNISEELATLDARIAADGNNASLYIERGKLLWKLGRRGDAISDYRRAAALDPNGPGRLLAEHSDAIMDFFNPDLLNP